MAKYRKKPVVIEAFQLTEYTRKNNTDWPEWMNRAWNEDLGVIGSLYPNPNDRMGRLRIMTLEGEMDVSFGDFIIQGVKGELYPCKPDIFEMTYDRVQEPTDG